MGSVCLEQLHHLFSNNNILHIIPPRKLLSRRAAAASAIADPTTPGADMFSDSPRAAFADSSQKFLPYNSGEDSDDSDSDPYSSDHFRMFEFKVRRCTRSRSHDWTECPFAHPGEKARRRDPRRFHYSGTVCPEYSRGSCSRAENCEFAHGVFECWLHPSRYRTEACKDGKKCKRKICFFAHTPHQLRMLPVQPGSPFGQYQQVGDRKHQAGSHQMSPQCCMFCHHHTQVSCSFPTSTLMGMAHLSPPLSPSQPLSPSLSPMKQRSLSMLSTISRYADRIVTSEQAMNTYKEVLNEIIGSLEVMNVNHCDDQPQFILSPVAAPVTRDSFHTYSSSRLGLYEDTMNGNLFRNNKNAGDGLVAASDPDLGWVNDLLT